MRKWKCPSFLIGLVITLMYCLGNSQAREPIDWGKRLQCLEKRIEELEKRNRYLERQLQLLQKQSFHSQQISKTRAQKMADHTWVEELLSPDNKMKLYGFLRLDTVYHDSKPQNPQYTYWIRSEDRSLRDNNDDELTIYPRLTRFGIKYWGPRLERPFSVRLEGKFEMDFQNGGRESRQVPRIRHAYLKLQGGDISLLAGQTWDIISPLYPTVNSDSLMWNTGNLGDRRPQIRLTYESAVGRGRLSLTGGAGLSSAIDAKDLDHDGTRDGEDSGLPNLQFRLAYSSPLWLKNRHASIGIWGLKGWEESTGHFDSYALGLDLTVPLSSHLSLQGELWKGKNLSDFRGGIGQGINTEKGQEIDSFGGWLELKCRITSWYLLVPGYTIDNPRDNDISYGGRLKNWSFYIANRLSLGGGFMVGLDYIYWKTIYKGLKDGNANRFNLFFQYNF